MSESHDNARVIRGRQVIRHHHPIRANDINLAVFDFIASQSSLSVSSGHPSSRNDHHENSSTI
jgi:hypothetical protein